MVLKFILPDWELRYSPTNDIALYLIYPTGSYYMVLRRGIIYEKFLDDFVSYRKYLYYDILSIVCIIYVFSI